MKQIKALIIFAILLGYSAKASAQRPETNNYLDSVNIELTKKWPKNHLVNLVFHGHSVVAGYFKTPEVRTFESYPFLTLKSLKETYPTAVVNSIVTAIGGENAEQGAKRFQSEVLSHRPDVLFIDYGLNDRSIGLERAKTAWTQMITEAKTYGCKIILLTPTPDLNENILNDETPLAKHAIQIRELAATYQVGLIDSYAIFKTMAKTESLDNYMAQKNHINERGHDIVAKEILMYFN